MRPRSRSSAAERDARSGSSLPAVMKTQSTPLPAVNWSIRARNPAAAIIGCDGADGGPRSLGLTTASLEPV